MGLACGGRGEVGWPPASGVHRNHAKNKTPAREVGPPAGAWKNEAAETVGRPHWFKTTEGLKASVMPNPLVAASLTNRPFSHPHALFPWCFLHGAGESIHEKWTRPFGFGTDAFTGR